MTNHEFRCALRMVHGTSPFDTSPLVSNSLHNYDTGTRDLRPLAAFNC